MRWARLGWAALCKVGGWTSLEAFVLARLELSLPLDSLFQI